MMAITEKSAVAAIMTLLMYGVLPVLIILYLGGGARRRRRNARKLGPQTQRQQTAVISGDERTNTPDDQTPDTKT